MKRLIVFAAAAFLGGCALTPEQAASLSTLQLCQIALAPLAPVDRQNSAIMEIEQRGESCDRYAPMIAQQNAAAMQILSRQMTTVQPYPQPAPSLPVMTNCNSYGNRINCTTW